MTQIAGACWFCDRPGIREGTFSWQGKSMTIWLCAHCGRQLAKLAEFIGGQVSDASTTRVQELRTTDPDAPLSERAERLDHQNAAGVLRPGVQGDLREGPTAAPAGDRRTIPPTGAGQRGSGGID